MTLLGLPLAQLGLLFGGAATLVTLLYVLKLRRRRVTVPFARLWDRVQRETESTSLFRRLKRLLSLLIQLLFLLLLAAALGDPRLGSQVLEGRNIILLLDASASMQAVEADLTAAPGQEGGGRSMSPGETAQVTRMDQAVHRARRLVRSMGGDDHMMIVRMAGQATPLSPFTSDGKVLLRALDGAQAGDTPASLTRALQFCADALRGRKRPLLVLISDGAFPEAELQRISLSPQPAEKDRSKQLDRVDLTGVEMRYLAVGRRADNLGIVAFNARRYPRNKLSFELFLEVVNYRETPAQADLALYSDGQLIEVQRLRLSPGKRSRFVCDPADPGEQRAAWCKLAAGGELLEARLFPPGDSASRRSADQGGPRKLDSFPLDDRAWALLPRRERQKVLLVTKGNLYLEGALLLEEGLEITRVRPSRYTSDMAKKVDAVIFDRFFPKTPPAASYLAVAPPDASSPIPVKGRVRGPLITEQNSGHPVMRWVTLKDVNISESAALSRGPGVEVLAASFRKPLIVARQDGDLRSVLLGFDLTRSDLPMRVAFPLLVMNSLDWFSGESEDLVTSFRAGERLDLRAARIHPGARAGEVTVVSPRGHRLRVPVEQGRVAFSGGEVGVYKLKSSAGDKELRVAANLAHAGESNTRPRAKLTVGGRQLKQPEDFGGGMRSQIWPYLLLAAAALLLLEWLSYNRRVTV